MDSGQLSPVLAAAAYIEEDMARRLDLETVARAAGYSKYHLHRLFTGAVGLPLHSYLRRRRLTEGARLLITSEAPILEIALSVGYESQQAISTAFKAMYKVTPLDFRRGGTFYPLQLPFRAGLTLEGPWRAAFAGPEDLPAWMDFLPSVIGGFPRLDRAAHLADLRDHLGRQEVLLLRTGSVIVGGAAFSRQTGHIHFLAVRPQPDPQGAGQALLEGVREHLSPARPVTITTFRRGDPADPGQRQAYRELGFVPGELLTEFGYPTQRLLLPLGRGRA